MSSTSKGNIYEGKVLALVKHLIEDGTIPVGKQYKVFSKKKYVIEFGNDELVADISVETYNPHFDNQITFLSIIECKNLSRPLDKSDFDEWCGKMAKLGVTGHKLYFVTPNGYTQPEINLAIEKGVALIVWNGKGQVEWKAPRAFNDEQQRKLNFEILRGESTSTCFPLIFDGGTFYNCRTYLKNSGIRFGASEPKAPFIPREKIRDLITEITETPDFYHHKAEYNEEKLLSLLGFRIDVRPLPLGRNSELDLINRIIIIAPDIIADVNRRRFALSHELGHVVLHSEVLLEYYDTFNDVAPSSDFMKFTETQANYFASYLLMPHKSFSYEVKFAFKTSSIFTPTFVYDNQPGKWKIYDAIVNYLAVKFRVSKKAVEVRLEKDGYVIKEKHPKRADYYTNPLLYKNRF